MNCKGDACGAQCDGANCAQFCGQSDADPHVPYVACARTCVGEYCGGECWGDLCAAECTGAFCGAGCIGDYCAAGCTGANCAAGCVGLDCDALEVPPNL
jgi:hypothetical protein